ncbi:MAG: DEAD/DEAH box helicase [Spirochaetales bacterium]|nr:DEAD/DEAH box helicase [Spirochaetales bacterium]
MVDKDEKPLIVQSDSSLMLEVHNTFFEAARNDIAAFSELEKSPEHIHTYRISPLSLWNAASAGITSNEVTEKLEKWSKFDVPENVLFTIRQTINRYGQLVLKETDNPDFLYLEAENQNIITELESRKSLNKLLMREADGFLVKLVDRGSVKVELIKAGWPVKDIAPLIDGEKLDFSLRAETLGGMDFNIRDYQITAAESFYGDGKAGFGFGTVVMPCGSGKTIVGMKAMDLCKTNTLIITTNIAAVHQWMNELKDKANIDENLIGEYTGSKKEIKPITIATYQILTWRPDKDSDFPHFKLFSEGGWGLIVYDEVHLLPAPVFRVTAEIQAVRRIGLTATLLREDGHEADVFSLVGPKRFDVPWKELEAKGWIAEAACSEIRVDLPEDMLIQYAAADKRAKFRIASENPRKLTIVKQLVENHSEDLILVIGQYLNQLHKIAKMLKAPIITGKTPNAEREVIYQNFREGKERVIVVSKVANFAIDLPDASIAIQVSGTFGSRQEEAQRLGRILRPKKRNSWFYSVVSNYTTEEVFSANRQKFLTEQGYKYNIEIWDEVNDIDQYTDNE